MLLLQGGVRGVCLCMWPHPASPSPLTAHANILTSLRTHARIPSSWQESLWFALKALKTVIIFYKSVKSLVYPTYISSSTPLTATCCNSHVFIPQFVSRSSLGVRQKVEYPKHLFVVHKAQLPLCQNCTHAGWPSAPRIWQELSSMDEWVFPLGLDLTCTC